MTSFTTLPPREFEEDYIFKFDTTGYPFKLSLKRANSTVKSYVRYNRNLRGIEKTLDVGAVCTRMYALGYGEGINQLGIERANPTGKPYIDAPTQNKYGVIEKIWVDRRYKLEDNLYSAALTKIEKLQEPPIYYTIEAEELYHLTKIPLDEYNVGDCVRVIDEELELDVTAFVVNKSKSNIDKNYLSADIELSTSGELKKDSLSSLMERNKINEIYSQGATNITTHSFCDNCDTNFPAKIRFRIPDEAVQINKVELSFQADAFRSYSKANTAAPITTSGQSSIISSGASSTNTSSQSSITSSGATSKNTSGQSTLTSAGPSSSSTAGQSTNTSSGSSSQSTAGQSTLTSSGASSQSTTGQSTNTSSGASSKNTTSTGNETVLISKTNYSSSQPLFHETLKSLSGEDEHWHYVENHAHILESQGHTHNMEHTHNIAHTHNIEHNHNIAHTHNIEHTHNIAHTHNIEHTHNIAHTHNIEHTHNIAHTHNIEHTHNIAHTHEIPKHNHDIVYGIYEGPTAGNFEVKVDGNLTNIKTPKDMINIVDYLGKSDDGRIIRGWHEVLIYPDDLCRINADIMVQVFVNSNSGGNY